MLLLLIVLTIAGCLIWTVIDRRRTDYNILTYWLTIIIRYYLAFILIRYGFGKIFRRQFPAPGPFDLQESYGEASPMGLAWTFFGYSRGYNYFTGFFETISGVLLLFRRTIRVGSVIALVVMVNIIAVNFCFDVCVKLFSTALGVMILYLLWQNRKGHVSFFLLNRHAAPVNSHVPVFRRKWFNISLVILKYVLIVFVLYKDIAEISMHLKTDGDDAPKPFMYGIYNVKTFVKNNDTLPPLTTDTTRWRKFIVFYDGVSAIRLMNDSIKFYIFNTDTTAKKIAIYSRRDTANKSTLAYSFPGKNSLLLQGRWRKDNVKITMEKVDLDNYLLRKRGFHFINERPFNR